MMSGARVGLMVVPTDVLENIISQLCLMTVVDDKLYTASLQACNLTCQDLYAMACRRLFRLVVIKSSVEQRLESFLSLLKANPAIGPYVWSFVFKPEKLVMDANNAAWVLKNRHLPTILQKLTRLRNISFSIRPARISWDSFSPEMRRALLSVSTFPILESIDIQGITDIPIEMITQCTGIRQLLYASASFNTKSVKNSDYSKFPKMKRLVLGDEFANAYMDDLQEIDLLSRLEDIAMPLFSTQCTNWFYDLLHHNKATLKKIDMRSFPGEAGWVHDAPYLHDLAVLEHIQITHGANHFRSFPEHIYTFLDSTKPVQTVRRIHLVFEEPRFAPAQGLCFSPLNFTKCWDEFDKVLQAKYPVLRKLDLEFQNHCLPSEKTKRDAETYVRAQLPGVIGTKRVELRVIFFSEGEQVIIKVS